MRSSTIERRSARIRQQWSNDERLRRAEESATRIAELIELLSGGAAQAGGTPLPAGTRRHAKVHAAS